MEEKNYINKLEDLLGKTEKYLREIDFEGIQGAGHYIDLINETLNKKQEKMESIEIDLSYEDYYLINEAARKKNLLLDAYVCEVLEEWAKKYDIENKAKGV